MKLKRYAIKEDFDNQGKILGVLNYDEESKKFTIDIAPELSVGEAPFILDSFIERGERHIGSVWGMRWVQNRIVPSTRQNIGQILRAHGMKEYDEYALLVKNQGRCCQDECYIEEIE